MPIVATTVVGLTTGSIGFTITLYKTALELYSVFTSAASLGEDAQVLQAQLFIQEALFKRWGDGLGLTKGEVEDVDPRLKREGEGTLFQAAIVGLMLRIKVAGRSPRTSHHLRCGRSADGERG
jgi:hypothetical protein